MLDMVEGTIIEILDGENVVGTWGLGELRYSKMGETMYLP
jgi:hypothetical protein